MNEDNCGICRMLANYSLGKEELRVVYESELVLAVHSTKPFAEVHVFIVSKQHIPTIFDLSDQDDELALELMKAVRFASQEIIALKGGCKLEMYLGEFQNTNHLHCHVIYDSSID